MLIPHDTRIALDTVVDLVNTAPENGLPDRGPADITGQRPTGGPPDASTGAAADQLADIESLYAFAERHLISGVGTLGEKDLRAVQDVRSRFAEIFAAPDARTAADLVNRLVAAAGTTPQLTDHDGYDWHVHYFAPDASISDHLAADCGMALAFFVVAGEQERLRRCEAPDCRRAFVDLSRNRSRRYCSSRTCGNRLHVAAYRARRREAAG
ncbi:MULTISPECIES: CGNR zinc finger domain-containing protein [unclassified Streptomyces]|uniref:CGNR zinc finger domain-containing protein n=1 Tax=unclassified Streptomyces TaxID=2593676 RepID=UPI00342861B2